MPPPNPEPNADLVKAEKRAEARRAQEKKAAEAAAEKQKAAEQAAAEKLVNDQIALAKLREKVPEALARAAEPIEPVRKRAEALRARADELQTAIGNLEGSITTARDVARHDPQRAFDGLTRALVAFGQIANRKS